MLRMMPGITGHKPTSVMMSRERVLVVDDEQDLLELVSYNLNKEGYRVVGVGSGEEALAAAPRRAGLDPARLAAADGRWPGSLPPSEGRPAPRNISPS